MASIAEVVRKGKGTAGKWHVRSNDNGHHQLYHYTTLMMEWEDLPNLPDGKDGSFITYTGLGHGTVSDQQGMNRAFRALGKDFYYSRHGGARISQRWG